MKLKLNFDGYEQQEEFLLSPERTVVFQAGAGAGKTFTGCFWSIVKAITMPGSRGLITSPSHPQMEQSVIPHFLDMGHQTRLNRHWRWNRTMNTIRFWNGSLIFLRSADNPESLLGADVAWAWGDEVALWKRNAWRYFIGRVRQPGYKQQIAVTMTPKGRNWTYKELSTSNDTRRVIKARTKDNLFLGQEYLDHLSESYGVGTLFYEQEAGGEYVSYEGLIYDIFDHERHIKVMPNRIEFDRVIAGIDWGWSNPFVILVVGVTKDGDYWLFHEVYESHKTPDEQIATAIDLQNKYNIETFYADPSEPGTIESMRRAGVNCVPAINEVVPGIATVNGMLKNERMYVAKDTCQFLTKELEEYKWKQDNQGDPKPDQPDKVYDHAMDALRYVAHSEKNAPKPFMQLL